MNERFGIEPDRWLRRWREALDACSRLGGDARPLEASPAAAPSAVEHIERQLGVALPGTFRRVLLEFSAEVEFSWFLPEGHQLPRPFHDIFCGGCSWSLRRLPEVQQSLNGWISTVFPNPENPYDRVWHGKLGILEVGNGDLLALDLHPANAGAVVYLSHDDGEGHGYSLGHDFADFVGRWSELGCPGAEDWQWLPFTDGEQGPLEPNGPRAREWRSIFGMPE